MKEKKKYLVNVVEEGIMNEKYFNFVGGRVEILDDKHPYSIDEIRFFTNKKEEWNKFREKWDFEEVSKKQLKQITKIVKNNFYQVEKIK